MIRDIIKMMLEVPEEFNLEFLENLIKYYKDDSSTKSALAIQCLIVYLKLSNVTYKEIDKQYEEFIDIKDFYDKLKH